MVIRNQVEASAKAALATAIFLQLNLAVNLIYLWIIENSKVDLFMSRNFSIFKLPIFEDQWKWLTNQILLTYDYMGMEGDKVGIGLLTVGMLALIGVVSAFVFALTLVLYCLHCQIVATYCRARANQDK
jgi:hypothetical protein